MHITAEVLLLNRLQAFGVLFLVSIQFCSAVLTVSWSSSLVCMCASTVMVELGHNEGRRGASVVQIGVLWTLENCTDDLERMGNGGGKSSV